MSDCIPLLSLVLDDVVCKSSENINIKLLSVFKKNFEYPFERDLLRTSFLLILVNCRNSYISVHELVSERQKNVDHLGDGRTLLKQVRAAHTPEQLRTGVYGNRWRRSVSIIAEKSKIII